MPSDCDGRRRSTVAAPRCLADCAARTLCGRGDDRMRPSRRLPAVFDEWSDADFDYAGSMWGDASFPFRSNRFVSNHLTAETIERFIDRFGYPRFGTGRLVFLDGEGRQVYKLAYTDTGLTENVADTSGECHGVPIAQATIAEVLGVDVVCMEYVEPDHGIRHRLVGEDRVRYDWIRAVDMWQVGWTDDRRLVAYDSGRIDLSHRRFQCWPD